MKEDAARATAGPRGRTDIMKWRKAERRRQLDQRVALNSSQRLEHAAGIARYVLKEIGGVTGITVSLYWPVRGEPDLRNVIERITRAGGRCALPVVVERGQPLEFHSWQPGQPLKRGFWNIPIPSAGEKVMPDVIIAPVVAFDRASYRLGYGGGYFDRTLSAISGDPRVLGVGYAMAEIDTIYPQSHDIPMDTIVTERGAWSGAT